jgi:hypothetical protein
MPVLPSDRVHKFGSHWADLNEILYMSVFRESVGHIQVSLKT